MSDGLLLLDKPAGPTSHRAVACARRALGTRRVGHAGTLDPGASGLLLVLVGRATRLARFLAPLEKRYEGTVRLGWETTTDDAAGVATLSDDEWRGVDLERVVAAANRVAAAPTQQPPAVSAKRIGGERAYRRVWRGERVVPASVPVRIAELVVRAFRPPEIDIAVRCSGGTYVRAIARDLGRELGSRAHLASLRRVAVGPWHVDDALPLAALEAGPLADLALHPPAETVAHLPRVEIGADAAALVRHGRRLSLPELPSGPVAVLANGELVAVAEARDGVLIPQVVLAP